ncbi:hypothetical protein PNOK_0750400 [Pyrrhoderma noxium]|uniref:Protein kinase domain-containing protein n=1 Tax=Pyrrhoderma noxium TaxID=2282107 RepID=A0A286UCY6_9AGAM|nr:hypothetical protein PNOK_0750400 [Pyrrhoderma noxium]
MAPEQVYAVKNSLGKLSDTKLKRLMSFGNEGVDVWALGIMILELLTNQSAYNRCFPKGFKDTDLWEDVLNRRFATRIEELDISDEVRDALKHKWLREIEKGQKQKLIYKPGCCPCLPTLHSQHFQKALNTCQPRNSDYKLISPTPPPKVHFVKSRVRVSKRSSIPFIALKSRNLQASSISNSQDRSRRVLSPEDSSILSGSSRAGQSTQQHAIE